MEFAPETFRRQYDELSDEALLSIDRKDLIEAAQVYYDAEVARRGLQSEEAPPEADEKEALVPAWTFFSSEEASLGRALLRSADVPAYLEHEMTPKQAGAEGELRIFVPVSFLEQATEILESEVSDEDLLAQAEAAAPAESDEDEDGA